MPHPMPPHRHHHKHRCVSPHKSARPQEHAATAASKPVEETPSEEQLWEIPDEEVEDYLATIPEGEKKGRFWNLPNIAGLSLLAVGLAYLLQQMGLWQGVDVSFLVNTLPWIGALLILLIGTGILSRTHRARSAKKKEVKKRRIRTKRRKPSFTFASGKRRHKRLTKSRNRKIAGVCAGIAEYFDVDPTLVRALFAIGLFISGGQLILLYLFLAFIMPPPEHANAR